MELFRYAIAREQCYEPPAWAGASDRVLDGNRHPRQVSTDWSGEDHSPQRDRFSAMSIAAQVRAL